MDVPAIIARVDELHKDNKWREVYEYVKEYADEASDPDLLWRILRAYYRVGKHLAKDKQEQTDIAAKAESLSEKALKLCPDNFHFHKVAGDFLCKLMGIIDKHFCCIVVDWHSDQLEQ